MMSFGISIKYRNDLTSGKTKSGPGMFARYRI